MLFQQPPYEPATKPEKKKFTHANVSVCREKKLIKLTDLAFV